MTDATSEQLQARIETIAHEWKECLGLSWWNVSFHYYRDSGVYAESGENLSPGSKAYTSASWAYLDAAIHFNLSGLFDYNDTQLEEVVVHELTHILVHEMRSGTRCDCPYDIRHEERVCTTLQRAFVWTKEYFLRIAHENVAPPPGEETALDAG